MVFPDKNTLFTLNRMPDRLFWWRWVKANALGEFLGLGLTALLAIIAFTWLENLNPLVPALLMIAAGTLLEGVVVGLAQWSVLKDAIDGLSWQIWAGMTALGAFIAWTMGMVPSTLFSLTETSNATQSAPEISMGAILALAAVMGLILGPILGLPQWWVLRRHVNRSGWWISANAVAWMFGMVLIFAGTSLIPEEGLALFNIIIMLAALLLAGATVGAVHGTVLVWLLRQPSTANST